jgi:error-prone DNA polymerase
MASLLEKYGWHEWLCHTNFSFLIGASHPQDYVDRAADLDYAGIGITDFDGAYGLARSYRALIKMRKHRPEHHLKLFYGAEIHLKKDHNLPILLQDTLVLIAKSHLGYHNLCKILTYSHREGKRNASIPWEYLVSADVTDIVAIQPMRGILRYATSEILKKRFGDLTDIFRGQLYFIISRHLNPMEDKWIPSVLKFIEEFRAPCLLSQDPFFHAAKNKNISDLLHAIRNNRCMDDAVEQMFVNAERCLHSLPGIEVRFSKIPIYEKALRDSYDLAQSIDFSFKELKYVYPRELIPDGHTSISWLSKLVWDSAKAKHLGILSARIASTISRELILVEELGFADYFLTVWDIVRWARSQGILCQGRGSAANSAICFFLEITAVDPSLFDLLFERFMSAERGDPPDIDVDFEHERREEVIQYIYARYGRKRAAMVANVITFKKRGAIRFAGKALGIPDGILDRATKILINRRHGSDMSELMADLNKDVDIQTDTPIPWDLWLEMARAIKGFPRHLGIHSGGFMIASRDLDWLVPQEPATMEGRSVIQWCKEDIEDLGFFKIDILALGILTAIRKSFALIHEHYGRSVELSTIPPEDPATYAMIQRADTVGVFQIESRAQMSMLPRLRPKTFYDLVIEVAIIRPGPIQGGLIHPYLNRRDGKEAVIFPVEALRPILARTLGVPIFQEQVMRIAMEVGGFNAGEADEFRRHMGAWQVKGDLSPWLSRLEVGMKKSGVPDEFIAMIVGQMKGFADYGFPESHAVSFALLAYASSWLKCHYPASFFTAILNSQPMGFYTPNTLVQAAKRAGVTILPICINHSQWDCSMESIANSHGQKIYAIRIGFSLVCSLSRSGMASLLKIRAELGGSWSHFDHFMKTSSLNKADLTALAAANAFAIFDIQRRTALWAVAAAPFSPTLEDVESTILFAIETPMERLHLDFSHSQSSLGDHPSQVIRKEYWPYPITEKQIRDSASLEKSPADSSVNAFGMIIIRQAPPSANGMVFVTLEDEFGFINLVFTPAIYANFSGLIERQSFLCISGKLQKNRESHSILVRHVYEPKIPKGELIHITQELSDSEKRQGISSQNQETATAAELQKSRNYM